MSNQTTDIIIDDGKQTYNIKNQDGELLGSFRLNPADAYILKRYGSVQESLAHITDGIDTSRDMEEVEAEITAKVKEQINYLFDTNCADEFFKITSPWSIMKNGEFFLEHVIQAVGNVIQADIAERNKKIDSRIKKYTDKYHG